MEIWKTIKDYEKYQVSNLSRFKSLKFRKEKILKTYISNGYLKVSLNKNGKNKSFKVSRLVAIHFIPNPENKPEVNHIDGNKLNNNINNLEWCTRSENMLHAFKTKLRNHNGENNPFHKYTLEKIKSIRLQYALGIPQKELVKIYKINKITINKIVNNKTWSFI